MHFFKQYILTIIMISISQFVMESSGAVSPQFLTKQKVITTDGEIESTSSQEGRQNVDGGEGDLTYETDPIINKVSIPIIRLMMIKSQNSVPSKINKLQYSYDRKRRFSDSKNKQDGINLFNHSPKLGSEATSENIFKRRTTYTTVNADSTLSTQRLSGSDLLSKDTRSDITALETETSGSIIKTANENIQTDLPAVTKPNISSFLSKLTKSAEAEVAESRHEGSQIPLSTADVFSEITALENKTLELDEATNNTTNQNISDASSLLVTTEESTTTKSALQEQDNATTTMLEINNASGNNLKSKIISLVQFLSTTSPVESLRVEHKSNMKNKVYNHDKENEESVSNDNVETRAKNAMLKEKKSHSNSSDQAQTSGSTFVNSLHVDNSSNEDTNIEFRNKFEDIEVNNKTEEEQKATQKEDGQEIENKEINGKEEPSSCPTCGKNGLTEEDVKHIRLDMFKDLLAQKLRLNPKDMPKEGVQSDKTAVYPAAQLPLPIVEQTIKDNAEEAEKDQFYARDEEIIIAGKDMGKDCVKEHITGCYSFNLLDKIEGVVAEAHLWVYKTKDRNDDGGQTFNVSQLERRKSGQLEPMKAITSTVTGIKEGWVKLNVTSDLRSWVDKKTDKQMLAIRCPTCGTKSYKSLFGAKLSYKPMLVVQLAAGGQVSRNKRSESCDPRSECCKRDLDVNFHDLSMVEVYEPRNLSIGYCYGNCNDIHQATYNHTSLLQQRRYSNSHRHDSTMFEQLMPCCVPLVLKDVFVLMAENGRYVRKVLPKVVVETCGCL